MPVIEICFVCQKKIKANEMKTIRKDHYVHIWCADQYDATHRSKFRKNSVF